MYVCMYAQAIIHVIGRIQTRYSSTAQSLEAIGSINQRSRSLHNCVSLDKQAPPRLHFLSTCNIKLLITYTGKLDLRGTVETIFIIKSYIKHKQ